MTPMERAKQIIDHMKEHIESIPCTMSYCADGVLVEIKITTQEQHMQRYDSRTVEMDTSSNGEYVLYTDHAKLRDALVQALEDMVGAHDNCGNKDCPDCKHAFTQARAALAHAKE